MQVCIFNLNLVKWPTMEIFCYKNSREIQCWQSLIFTVFTIYNLTLLKVAFFQKLQWIFFRSPNLKKKYSKKLSWAWNLNILPITVKCEWRDLDFKLKVVFWNIFFEIWRSEKRIALSEKKPPLDNLRKCEYESLPVNLIADITS